MKKASAMLRLFSYCFYLTTNFRVAPAKVMKYMP